MPQLQIFICLLAVIITLSYVLAQQQHETTGHPKTILPDGTEIIGQFEELHIDLLPAHGKVESYYGIPYSEPPVGPLRFKLPVLKENLDSPFLAQKVGRSCMQTDPEVTGLSLANDELSEDCLFLDVIVPHPKPTKAHVYVFIHGGGFVAGAGNMPGFINWIIPAVYGNIIIVTLNYRLGAFGQLSTGDDLIPGNLGFFDQRLALEWIQKNIEAFGGDPQSVTIGGVSAGAASAGFQVISPGSKGLFKGAIMQSGGPFDVPDLDRSKDHLRTDVATLAQLVGCSEGEIADDAKLLACLQAASASDILEMSGKIGETLGDPTRMPPMMPIIDGDFLPESPLSLVEGGSLNGDSLIMGTNADEGTLFLYFAFPDPEVKPVVNQTSFASAVSVLGLDPLDDSLIELVRAVYTPSTDALLDESRDDFFHEASGFLGDKVFMCHHSKFSRLAAASVNVYRYTMTHVPSVNCMGIKWAGAAHGDEGQFVGGMVFEESYANRTSLQEKEMSRKAMDYWLNFIKTGNPNTGEEGSSTSALPEWPKYTKDSQLSKDLTPEMGNIAKFRQRECHFHDNILPGLKKDYAELRKLQQRDDEKAKWTEGGQCTDGSCEEDIKSP